MYYNEAGFQPTIYNMAASPNSSSSGNSLPNNTAVWGAYMLKFNSSGTYQYGTVLGAGTGFQTDTYYNACDSSGNIYMTGYYISTSTLTIYNMSSTPGASSSGYTMPSSNNKGRAYTIKFNSSGTYQYSLSFGESTQDASLNNVAVDSSGNVYFAGYWRGAPTIYNMTLSPSTSSTGYSLPYQTIAYTVLLKYNSSGTYQSSTYINQSSSYGGVATDSMGNVYWGGFYQGSVAAPLYNLTANPNSTSTGYSLPNPSSNYWTFLVQYDSSGNYKTATGFFAGPYAFAQNVGIDSSGRLYSLIQATTNGGTTLYTPTANPATSSSGYTFPSTGNVGVGITLKFTFAPPVNITPLSMTLTNLGAGVTTVVEKPIYNLSGNAVTVTENSNIWTIPAASNVATAMWTIDRWLITSYTSLVPIGPELYSFTTATFTPGGATGQNGPIISQARSGLTGTPAPSAWSGTYLTMSTQGYQLWTVPATGSYTITAAGAIGAITSSGGLGGAPGSGYVITTTLSLTAGQVLKILVGQTGTSAYGAGGGGGTFIATSANSPLVCCGGGGGTTYDRGAGSNATGTGGGDTAGADGAGGSSGGCGMNGAGGASFTNNSAYAQSFINGGVGGPMPSGGCVPVSYGGFGGGAGGGNGGGGGGGYTGGAGGINNPYTGGVGGGSYCATTVTSTSLNTGVGYVTITKL
jgi:hypothetical protein